MGRIQDSYTLVTYPGIYSYNQDHTRSWMLKRWNYIDTPKSTRFQDKQDVEIRFGNRSTSVMHAQFITPLIEICTWKRNLDDRIGQKWRRAALFVITFIVRIGMHMFFYGHVGMSYTRCLQIAGAMRDPRSWISPNCAFKKMNFRVGCGVAGSLFRYCSAALYFDIEQSNDKVSASWELVPCEVCAWTWDVAFCKIIFQISKNNVNF